MATKIFEILEDIKISKVKKGTSPYIEIGDIDKDSKKITLKEKASVSGAVLCPAGSVIVSRVRPDRGAVALVENEMPITSAFTILKPKEKECLVKFLYYYLAWNDNFFSFLQSRSTGITYPTVKEREILDYEITFLPSIAEQKRIVTILEEAESLKKKHAETDQKMGALIPALFVQMFGDIHAKNSTHPWGTIRQFVRAESGKSSKVVLSTIKTEFPIYGGNGINGWAKRSLYDEPVVIAGRVGQQCGVIHLSQGPCWVTDNAIVITIQDTNKLNPIYLADALRNSSLRRTVEQLDLPYINQSILLDAQIPLPKIELQNQYANLVKEIEVQKDKQKQSATKLDGLFRSLISRAFTGKL